MSENDDLTRLRHMRDHALEAIAIAEGQTVQALSVDRIRMHALCRVVEIVGEAADRVSGDGQRMMPEIPWSDVIGMRHRIVHGYDRVDLEILWKTVELDLPPLIKTVEAAIAKLEAVRKSGGAGG